MATMIPEKPRSFDPASQEGIMFDALAKLPDDYYVFHSFRISKVNQNTFHESETDFIIYNRNKGVICLEAKAGIVKYENGYWYYANGTPMHNGGPFNQASANKWKLVKYIESCKMSDILGRCKFLHAVWFPSVSDELLKTMILPSEADKNLVMTKEALSNPLPYIESIFNIELPKKIETNIGEKESQRFVREVFCPQFNVFPTTSFEADLKKIVFHRLLNEQAGILNYLDEQKTAVINGAAGTGKTMIAVEKAMKHAANGQKVLFLCYNSQLKKFLEENYFHENIDYYTISGLACSLCNTATADYKKLKNKLEDFYFSETFPYKHVVVDEGQDFGMDDIEETDILSTIKSIISDIDSLDGSFYVFYDKLQLIQAHRMPKYIEDADCKLTLYKNCRNTENIALTSVRPLSDRTPKLVEGCVKGAPAKINYCASYEEAIESVDEVVKTFKNEGIKDVVILTTKTENTSVLNSYISNGLYKNHVRFTTCRKFKGLEADAIILVDVDKDTFKDENVLLYYVGASRARLYLEIVAIASDDECIDILKNDFGYTAKIKKPKKDLSKVLNAIGIVKNARAE